MRFRKSFSAVCYLFGRDAVRPERAETTLQIYTFFLKNRSDGQINSSKPLDKLKNSCVFASTILTTRAEKQRTRVRLFLYLCPINPLPL